MTKRQLRRAAALLDQYADEIRINEVPANGIWPTNEYGTALKRTHNELRALAEALRKEADK